MEKRTNSNLENKADLVETRGEAITLEYATAKNAIKRNKLITYLTVGAIAIATIAGATCLVVDNFYKTHPLSLRGF